MIIAVLSGKGGTGKTLLSVNLSCLHKDSIYVDCDVEEPNGFLYFKPDNIEVKKVYNYVPIIDIDKCNGCGECVEFCKFNALINIKGNVKVFPDLCHSCGGCSLVCKENAITEKKHCIGYIKSAEVEKKKIFSGELVVGEESGVPIIKELLENLDSDSNKMIFIDSPPGNGCTVMESIKIADYCILVSEPSIFGLHNLEMFYKLKNVFNKRVGLVINKASKNKLINNFASENNINIIGEIPWDLELGRRNSNGEILVKSLEYKNVFEDILNNLLKEVFS